MKVFASLIIVVCVSLGSIRYSPPLIFASDAVRWRVSAIADPVEVWQAPVIAQQSPDDPEQPPGGQHTPRPCNRTGGIAKDGTILHACTCHPMTHVEGEECVRDSEDRACEAWCRPALCACETTCEII